MYQDLFPQYRQKRWAYLPLGVLAIAEQRPGQPNPLLDAEYCRKWVRRLHRRYRVSYSYGGWFEDRAILWGGHYLMPGNSFHLAIDFNVPQRSRVYSPTDGKVIEVWHDPDTYGGWGGRIVIEFKPRVHLILAHFGTICVSEGSNIRRGQFLGNVGNSGNNGNWFPHLHAQIVRGPYRHVDGYGEFSVANQRKFPDPFIHWPPHLTPAP